MSIKSLLEISIESILAYEKAIENHNPKKEYTSDIVSLFNLIGENIDSLSDEINDIFSDDSKYNSHFESDDIQEFISNELNKSFNHYSKLKRKGICEEKILLAYEWLFEVMLFTCDDEEIKSKITLNKNDLSLLVNKNNLDSEIKEKSKVLIKVSYDGDIEEMFLVVEELVDDYIYSYIGDKENEEDLIIFSTDRVFKVR